MAIYKVPQDVEAEDKLLGPFSFKQFVYLMVVAMAMAVAYGLSQISIVLIILPLPVILFFGALALPIRKDQPMEVYLAAIVSFLLKPRLRLWEADGVESLIEVLAPAEDSANTRRGKGYSHEEVDKRLSYLANIVDSQGWSTKGITGPGSSMKEDLYNEAQTVSDVLDSGNSTTQQINNLISQSDARRRQEVIDRMKAPVAVELSHPNFNSMTTTTPQAVTQAPINQPLPISLNTAATPPQPAAEEISQPQLVINPYPSMKQSVISPPNEDTINRPTASQAAISPQQLQQPTPPDNPLHQALQAAQPTQAPQPQTATAQPPARQPITVNLSSTSQSAGSPSTSISPSLVTASPGIINLANNSQNLNIETLSREANRIKKEEARLMQEEVVISLH